MPAPLIHLAVSVAVSVIMRGEAGRISGGIDSLGASIGRRIAEVKGSTVGVAFRNLATGDTLFIGADESLVAIARRNTWTAAVNGLQNTMLAESATTAPGGSQCSGPTCY